MTTPARSLEGRVALVTGGARGLGAAVCRDLAEHGAHVVVADLDVAGAARTAAELPAATPVELDVARSADVDRVVAEVADAHGPAFDVLVNNAGTDRGADLTEVDDEQWHAVFGVNVHGPMHLTRAFVRHLCAQQESRAPELVGDVVNVVSISALTVGAGAGAYNASKAALLKLTEVAQTEARERGWPVRVTALHPAAMATPMMDQWGLPPERMMDPAVVASLVRTAVCLPPEVVLQSLTVTLRNESFPR